MASARTLASLASLFALVACGGGGGGTTPTPSPSPTPSAQAVLSVALDGGATRGIDHLWVTVTGLAMHADATRVYGDGDSGWVVQPLDAPVSVDLASTAMANGGSTPLLKRSVSTLGNFAQLRLLLASSDPTAVLTTSASNAGLQYNDQVQYTDATGVHVAPLELPRWQAGVRVLTPFSLSADTTTPLAVEFNANSLVRRAATGGGADRFTLRDELQGYNLQLLTALSDGNLTIDGSIFDAISGQLDTTHWCTGTDLTGCIHDVVASATSLSVDGLFHQEVRSVDVAADGTFLLYPLPTQSLYDVVIHGGNMETIVVSGVFVDPTGLLRITPTLLSSAATPLVPVLSTGDRAVTVTNALAPAGSRVFFGQTVAGSGGGASDVPYAVATEAADPATGRLSHPVTLPVGQIHYAAFNRSTDGNGVPPGFSAVTPVEGLNAWSVWSQGTLATTTSAAVPLAAAATSVSAPSPIAVAGLATGTIAVTLSGNASNGADRAELIVSNDGGVVSVVDVSAQIATHGGSTTIDVPGGSASAAPAATVYWVALRTWVGAAEGASARWARASAPADLSAATTAAVSLALP